MSERTDELANEVAAKVVADELKQAVEEEAEAEAATAPTFEVILASSSPRRRELLDAAGVKFTVRTPATPVDESLEPDLAADPEEAAKKLAERKAGAVIQEVLAENYIGRTHEVITAVSVWMVAAPDAEDVSLGFRTFADISHVTFRDLTDEEITEYLRKGESFDKAGAYAIQGEGAALVDHYDGSLDTIIGLPATRLIKEFPDLVNAEAAEC